MHRILVFTACLHVIHAFFACLKLIHAFTVCLHLIHAFSACLHLIHAFTAVQLVGSAAAYSKKFFLQLSRKHESTPRLFIVHCCCSTD